MALINGAAVAEGQQVTPQTAAMEYIKVEGLCFAWTRTGGAASGVMGGFGLTGSQVAWRWLLTL